MNFYIVNTNLQGQESFWTGRKFSPEFPDADLYNTQVQVRRDLLKAGAHPDAVVLSIVDRRSDPRS